MTRLYGRAPQGKRLVDKVPHGNWETTTFICGLRYNSVTAPYVLDGPMDGVHFLAYVEQILESNDFSWGEKIGKYPYSAGFVGPD